MPHVNESGDIRAPTRRFAETHLGSSQGRNTPHMKIYRRQTFRSPSTLGGLQGARNVTREYKRHAASVLVADGLPIKAVSAMLGQALTSTTLNGYAHVLPGSDRLAVDAMERLSG